MKYYVNFDDMCWPKPDDTGKLEWALRYGNPTRNQQMVVASIVAAYKELIHCAAAKRALVVRNIRKTDNARN